MSEQAKELEAEVAKLYEKLEQEAKAGGYNLNPDSELSRDLLRGLLINQKRFGYPACPCRLAGGDREQDLDIICPCDYRDPDLNDYDSCYCGLYVSPEAAAGKKKIGSIPERRPVKREAGKGTVPIFQGSGIKGTLAYPVWRCKVCGYLCAREKPPGVCPVCKASRDRFERFL